MKLAAMAGLHVAPVSLACAAGRDVLLVERFDRIPAGGGWERKSLVSALTLLSLDEMMARYAGYEALAEIVRTRFRSAPETLRELFSRIVFNVLVGNTDDHARNHAAFWDGEMLTLAPGYDICPQPRHGRIATQAMLIAGDDRSSRLSTCLAAAPHFFLSEADAAGIIIGQAACIEQNWDSVCNEAMLSEVDRNLLWRNQILNPYIFEGVKPGPLSDFAGRYEGK